MPAKLSRIILHNFQLHRSLSLDLGDVTVLVGDSDCGKSSVIRAVSAFLNNDMNAGYASWGCSDFSVTLKAVDGSWASCTRTYRGVVS